jgi:glycosyltransferase involved in cell wall biosynthesis
MFGYTLMNQELRRHALAAGLEHDPASDIVVRAMSPMGFTPRPGKRNVLITMWESEDFPPRMRPYLDSADLVITPSRFAAQLLAPHIDAPLVRVPLGVDPAVFAPPARKRRAEAPFMWLMVGAMNARKGWDSLQDAWHRHFFEANSDDPRAMLYVKTTGRVDMAGLAAQVLGWDVAEEHDGVIYVGNVVVDMRALAAQDLVTLYHTAHAFAFPSGGEGWGLTLHEALATGLPAVATRWSGHLDFTDETTVRYVGWRPLASIATKPDGTEAQVMNSAWVDPDELAAAMVDIMRHYDDALAMGLRAARAVRTKFTWEAAGRTLARALARFAAGEALPDERAALTTTQ